MAGASTLSRVFRPNPTGKRLARGTLGVAIGSAAIHFWTWLADTTQVRRLPRFLWIATLGYWALLTVLTHIPLDRYIPEEQKKVFQLLDKPEHFVAYLVLTTLLGCALAASYPHRPRLVWLAVPVALLLGAVDEWTQAWVNRTCSLNDWIANAVGTFAGMVVVLLARKYLAARACGPRPVGGSPLPR